MALKVPELLIIKRGKVSRIEDSCTLISLAYSWGYMHPSLRILDSSFLFFIFQVVSQTFSTHSSKFASPKSSESRSTRKKASQKSLKSKLESIKKDLLEEASNQRNDSSVKNWQEEEQTMTELVSPSRTKAKVSAKNEAISSEISKLEEEEEEVEDDYSSIKTRSLRSSRSVTLTRRSSRLKTETSLRGATPTQTTPLSEVDSPQASTPPRRLGAPQTSTPLREVGASRTSTPPREVATSRPSTPPRDIGPSRTSTLRVLPVRTSTPTRGEQLSKVSDEKESSSPLLVNIKIKNQDESKVEMEETVPEFEPQVRTTRRITRKAAALQSQSELTANTESGIFLVSFHLFFHFKAIKWLCTCL